jgi:vitamin K-dependent gamma-carboxylase
LGRSSKRESMPLPSPTKHSREDSAASRVASEQLGHVDIAWLAGYRVLFGLAIAVSMQRFLAYGWVEELLVAPRFRFHYWGFAWVTPLSSGSMRLLFWILVGLGLAVAAGFAFRITAPLLAAGLTYIQLIDVSTYLNHYYLAGLLAWLFAVSPAARAWSVDAWLRERFFRSRRDPVVAKAWLTLFRVQIGIVYVCAGLAKAQSDWLLHGQPLGIWLGASTSLPLLGRLFTIDGVPLAMSWFGFLFDTTIVGWLVWRRSRPWAYAVVVVFHVLTRLLFDIGMFPIIMSISALVFFSPSWPRAIIRRLVPYRDPPLCETSPDKPVESRPLRHWVALGLGALYCVVQIVMPLRCHLYGGNVLWHEQGMRFSWRVMVRAKGGATTFLVRPKDGERVFHVSPREYLRPFQENEMASQPDLVLQLAHHIRDDFQRRGYGDVEVRAESVASLNGRSGAPLVDPAVDLTTIRDGVGAASWIMPAPREAPPHTRPVR